MSKPKNIYVDINKNFQLIQAPAQSNKGSFEQIVKKLKEQKIIKIVKVDDKYEIVYVQLQEKKEKWLVLKVKFSGDKKNQLKFRIQINPKIHLIKKKIDRIFYHHEKTDTFFITFDNEIITNSKSVSSFWIDLTVFYYWKNYGSFVKFIESKKRRTMVLVTDSFQDIFDWVYKNKNFPSVHDKDPKMLALKKEMIQEWEDPKAKEKVEPKNLFPIRDINEIEKREIDRTEREQIIKSRINQNQFRDKLLISYDKKCPISLLDNPKVLIASHVKPWSECENAEKLDSKNGILLSPLFDKLFDRGLISFNQDGTIIYSQKQLTPEFILKIQEQIKNEKYFHIIQRKVDENYLKYHREKVFDKK